MIETYGEFFGHDLTTQQCDVLTLTEINGKLLAKETGLFKTKWFDYRFMHPLTATYLFAHEYSQAYKDMSVKIFDVERGSFNKGWKGKDFLEKKERGGFWKARQAADELCIPYNYYMRFAIEFAIERCWSRIPRPTQIYSDLCIEAIERKWCEELSAGVIEPRTAYLRDENNKDKQVHIEMQRWLCSALRDRKNAHFGLSHYLFTFPIISEKIALQYFTVEEIQKAKRVAETL